MTTRVRLEPIAGLEYCIALEVQSLSACVLVERRT